MGYSNSIDNSPIQRVVAVDASGQPSYTSTLIPPATMNYGTPTSVGVQEAIDPALKINTTAKSTIDGNGQGTTTGITITMNGNGAESGLTLQNKNSGSLASADVVITSDSATDIVNGPFLDLGITSAAGNNPLYTVLPVGGYLFVVGYDLGIGTASAKDIIFHTNGTLAANERLRITSAGAVKVSGGPLQTTVKTVLGTTGTVSLDPTLGNLFTCTPSASITALNAATVSTGQLIYIVFTTSGTSSFVVTFNTNFKTTGTLTTGTVSGKVFTMSFISDGTNFNEVSRTTAM